jgi:rare lipoprotein A
MKLKYSNLTFLYLYYENHIPATTSLFFTFAPYLLFLYAQDPTCNGKIVMKRKSIRAAGFLAAFWLAGGQQAMAGCGLAGALGGESPAPGAAPSNSAHISAGHPSLPRGSRVVVRNQEKGRSIIVQIIGQGLTGLGKIIDLSAGAMHALGMEKSAPVCVEVLSYGSKSSGYSQVAMRNPFETRFASRRRYVKARTRLANAASRRKHMAAVHHGKGKRYADVHRVTHPVRKSGRRRIAA